MRILHFADLHLDHSFADVGLPASVGRVRRSGLRKLLIQICEIAGEQQVDAMTIAGDFFDDETVMPETLTAINEQFARIAPTPVLIAPGQSDLYTSMSSYARWKFPDNVHIFGPDRLSEFHLPADVTVWGVAYTDQSSDVLSTSFKVNGNHNLLLMYEPAVHVENDKESLIAHFVNNGIDFAVLGGNHQHQLFQHGVMAGSPDLLEPSTTGQRQGVTIVTVTQDNIRTEFIETGTWRFRSEVVDISGCENMVQVEDTIRQVIDTPVDENTYYTISLTGRPKCLIDVSDLSDAFSERVKFTMRLEPPYDLELLSQEPTVRGFLVAQFLEQMGSSQLDEQTQLLNALHIALQSLDGVGAVYNALEKD